MMSRSHKSLAAGFAATLTAIVIGSAIATSCGPRALVQVDVLGDAPFQGVDLNLRSSDGTSKVFSKVSFDSATAYKAGLYLPDSVSGNVTIVARALNSAGGCIGIGQVAVGQVNPGSATSPAALTVSHSSDCAASNPDGGPPAGGTGGSPATGAGGSGPGNGAGGASGGGLGGGSGGLGGAPGTGGASGAPGTGGASGPNLITNGDFSNGETGWALPAMMGSISHAVSGGAFCVTLSSATDSATVGYPAAGTPPFTINGGASYRFSYQASVNGGSATLEAKIGQVNPPYDATGSDWMNEPLGASLQTQSHTFTRPATDSMMGVAFNIAGGPSTVCIDNVSLTSN